MFYFGYLFGNSCEIGTIFFCDYSLFSSLYLNAFGKYFKTLIFVCLVELDENSDRNKKRKRKKEEEIKNERTNAEL